VNGKRERNLAKECLRNTRPKGKPNKPSQKKPAPHGTGDISQETKRSRNEKAEKKLMGPAGSVPDVSCADKKGQEAQALEQGFLFRNMLKKMSKNNRKTEGDKRRSAKG